MSDQKMIGVIAMAGIIAVLLVYWLYLWARDNKQGDAFITDEEIVKLLARYVGSYPDNSLKVTWLLEVFGRRGMPDVHERLRDIVYQMREQPAPRSGAPKLIWKDAAGYPKLEATLLEQRAIEALNEVKAWRDNGMPEAYYGRDTFPQGTRMKIEEALMLYELRRSPRVPVVCTTCSMHEHCRKQAWCELTGHPVE